MSNAVQVQGTNRPANYYDSRRSDLASLVPTEADRVLDVGCGAGRFGEELRRQGHEVTGIELIPAIADEAASRLDSVVCADIETDELPWPAKSFDAIIAADVLEHLADPWSVVRRLARLLVPGGCFIASVPNIQNWRIIRALIRGRWRYRERGILDHGHLRFFTREGILDLFARANLDVIRCDAVFRRTFFRQALCALSLGGCEPFLARSYHVVGRKGTE